jgi:hypothetical protein
MYNAARIVTSGSVPGVKGQTNTHHHALPPSLDWKVSDGSSFEAWGLVFNTMVRIIFPGTKRVSCMRILHAAWLWPCALRVETLINRLHFYAHASFATKRRQGSVAVLLKSC